MLWQSFPLGEGKWKKLVCEKHIEKAYGFGIIMIFSLNYVRLQTLFGEDLIKYSGDEGNFWDIVFLNTITFSTGEMKYHSFYSLRKVQQIRNVMWPLCGYYSYRDIWFLMADS